MTVISRHVTIDNSYQQVMYIIITQNNRIIVYTGTSGTDVTVGNLVFSTNDVPECVYHISGNEDIGAQPILLYVNIIIIGM